VGAPFFVSTIAEAPPTTTSAIGSTVLKRVSEGGAPARV